MGEKLKHLNNYNPKVSIIVGVFGLKGIDAIFNALDSFLPQEGDIEFEFIVVDVANEQRERIYRERFPWIKLIKIEKLIHEPHMRNIALQQAQGDIILFTEDHVLFPHNYLKTIVKAFSEGHVIVGGPVLNANPEVFFGWVQYFLEYNKWFPGVRQEIIEDLPGCNYAYHIDLVKKLGPFPEEQIRLDTNFHKIAREKGNKLSYYHDLKIAHINDGKIKNIFIQRFQFGRLFAARRGFAVWKRIAYIILSPVIAILEYIRIINHSRHDRTYLIKLIQTTPLLLPALFIWMAGECVGYITAAGSSGR